MSLPPIIQYPLDLNGTSPTNEIVGEVRDITTNTARVFVPMAGPFFTESFEIFDANTLEPLRPVDDYLLVQPFQQASLRSGKDVQCAVVLKVNAPIRITMNYRVIGGEYSWNLGALAALIEELDLDERPIKWGSVLGRPTAYPPAPHIHDIGDTYGWEYVTWQLERITNAILVGDEASHDELRAQMQYIRDQLEAQIVAVDTKVDNHIDDFNNPHRTTKAQVGLGNVDNFLTASDAEANAGVLMDRFMTPYGSNLLSTRVATEITMIHEARKDNPHAVTKAQVGLGLVDNFATATRAEAESQTVSNKFMTPLRTYQAIMFHVGNAFNAHAADTNNPHATTKAQVGLGLVDNFQTATKAEAELGSASNRFMTPQRTKEAIMFIAGNLLNAHISDINNPHQVTKAQVGLSNIPNAVTRARNLNSDSTLLLAGAMFDHINSGDHDNRYVRLNTATNTSLRVVNGKLQGYISGQWKQLWPATWSGHVAEGANEPVLGNTQEIQLLNAGGRLYATVDGTWRQVWPAYWMN